MVTISAIEGIEAVKIVREHDPSLAEKLQQVLFEKELVLNTGVRSFFNDKGNALACRVIPCLIEKGIYTVANLVCTTREDLQKHTRSRRNGLGKQCIEYIAMKLAEKNLKLLGD